MTILVDIGNTSIKKCKLKNKKLFNREHLDYSNKNSKLIEDFFKKDFLNKESFLFCSVVPDVSKFIINSCNKNSLTNGSVNKLLLKDMIDSKVSIDELGVDRIINYLGLKSEYRAKKNFLIIDFGTATTIDIIVDNIYLGGVILPGLITSYKNLISSASLLEDFEIKFTKLVYGTNTKNALLSGSFNGYFHMINGYIKQLQNVFNKRFKNIVTGGYGAIFSKNSSTLEYQKDLTFKGLQYYNDYIL